MKAIVKLDVPEWQIGEKVTVHFPDSMMKQGLCELDTNTAHWNCLDNYGGQVNGFECSKCKMPSKEDTEFCSSCGRWMKGRCL